ncbi:Murein DD-endopeptidase MepH [Mycolicibacterium vanbaalenii]|uniref:Murein DD-endopeptidase MepH n=1 Tax=Mycolicibacterium vanbaalenii TaxID=110539 RepID=A0A5S9R7R4_MYCVN|nr:C40 family peptidase [Mycolicibacterium vanbaalenii]CAA0131035.1 Murein DD-endopeptidase MepH [Mycolicibacterium vanbaalenii]
MPSALITALSTPIRRVQALVGPGWSGDPAADPAAGLAATRDMLADVAHSAAQAWQRTSGEWSGAGSDAAAQFAATTTAAIDEATERAAGLGVTAGRAAESVAAAHRRLQAIVDEFEARAGALEPHLDSPGVAEKLLTEARDALAEAVTVVEELLAELDGHAAALAPHAPAAPAATAPAGFGGAPAMGSGMGSGFGGGGGAPLGAPGWSGAGGSADMAAFTRPDMAETADAAAFGEGVAVRLPDGTVVMAPNAVAAGAVRHALTQLGVPYLWGGTTPGVGLDCSGLTQWAYHEAGLSIPRLAQEQDIGATVDPGSLRPGDLAVWDGHVAMIVGNGMMVEAGDPVQLSPVRTANAGQGFQGFWRPTA